MDFGNRSVEQLLAELRVPSTFGVVTGRMPAVGASATLAVAIEQARQLAEHPAYYAASGSVDMIVTKTESDALLADGAATDEIQIIRSFKPDRHIGFSDQCEGCRRWIYCGDSEHADVCLCGRQYRVTFDLTSADWTMRQGVRCMTCGTAAGMTEVREGRNPWRIVNAYQEECNRCSVGGSEAGVGA